MEFASMQKGYIYRDGILQLGGVEILSSQIKSLKWEEIPNDCLPVFIWKTTTPKALIAANRLQLDNIRDMDQDVSRECFIVEIQKLMEHSNLKYAIDLIERDRKVRYKKTRMLTDKKKAMMKDIITTLNRTKTAAEIGAVYQTTAFNINQIASKLRKPPYNFNIPGARGYDEFSVLANEIAKEIPGSKKVPLASKTPMLTNGHKRALASRN